MELPKRLREFVEPIITMCATQFPKKCNTCGKTFNSLREFVGDTKNLGSPQCSNQNDDPFGLLSYRNCTCGSTLTLNCTDPKSHAVFCRVLDEEVAASGRSEKDLLLALRSEVHRRVLGAPADTTR